MLYEVLSKMSPKYTAVKCLQHRDIKTSSGWQHVTVIIWQDAQLSQRDHAAGCIIVLAKSGKLELGDNILQTL